MLKERLFLLEITEAEGKLWNNGIKSRGGELSDSLIARLKKIHSKWKVIAFGMALENEKWYGDMIVEVPANEPEEQFTKRILEDGSILCNDPPYTISRIK